MPADLEVTFDYLCPFARNAHEALVTYVREGGGQQVRFRPFSLNQVHIPEDEPPVWERTPETWGSGVTGLLYGIAVRDAFPDQFLDFHVGAFALRHDEGGKLKEDELKKVAEKAGIDSELLSKEVWSGRPLATLAAEHREALSRWNVFGVPTFIQGENAVFIRFMERNNVEDLRRALELLDWTRLNEFKHTSIPK
ncbi:MAG: putative dithiol-disulfide isomerase involved in polyketide biosynthesis [Acidimicrobiia bacterium]|nr:putative dithiol-disulfide isomerase involved in polyketide biosynthesis [Acidimicrobiia bacterium]